MGKLRAALKLSPHDWIILAEMWVSLLVVDLALRYLSFRRIRRFATQIHEDHVSGSQKWAKIRHRQRLVNIAARHHIYPMSCLRQALVLQRFLGRQGIETRLQIGVRAEANSLDAHAWLECDGVPIGQTSDVMGRFAILKTANGK